MRRRHRGKCECTGGSCGRTGDRYQRVVAVEVAALCLPVRLVSAQVSRCNGAPDGSLSPPERLLGSEREIDWEATSIVVQPVRPSMWFDEVNRVAAPGRSGALGGIDLLRQRPGAVLTKNGHSQRYSVLWTWQRDSG